MTHSSVSMGSGCSNTSLSSSDFSDFSSLEEPVLLPMRATFYDLRCGGSKSIVSEEDSLWYSEYAKDILLYLHCIESNRKSILCDSPQICHRANLVAFIKRIAEAERLCRTTVHLAIYMLDVFMDNYKIIATKLNLVTLVCLLIASKVEECDQNTPKISTLNSYSDNQYTRGDFKTLERMVLKFFKWSVLVPTTATFLECLAHETVTSEEMQTSRYEEKYADPIIDCVETYHKHISTMCNNLILEFLELTLNERGFLHIKPSRLAAACMAACRKTIGIVPIWPERLQKLTKCSFQMVEEYMEVLICMRNCLDGENTDNIKKTPDSGCITDTETDSHDDVEDDYLFSVPTKRRRLAY